ISQDGDRGSGRIRRSAFAAPFVAPSAVLGLQKLQRLHQTQRLRQFGPQILIAAERQECAVCAAEWAAGNWMVSPVPSPKGFDAAQERSSQFAGGRIQAQSRIG